MSYQEDRFEEIAAAIRQKDGTTEPINATDFATRILAIEDGGDGYLVESENLGDGTQQLNIVGTDILATADATESDVLVGKTFFSGNASIKTGTKLDYEPIARFADSSLGNVNLSYSRLLYQK